MHRRLKLVALVAGFSALFSAVAWAATSPTVTTGSATSIKDTSAVLNGTINPNDHTTTYSFQWGLTTTYGGVSKAGTIKAGIKPVDVKATAAPLPPGTVIHYRLDAQSGSSIVYGDDRTFKTTGAPPPGVSTGPASSVTTATATVTGQIDPAGAPTTYFFQYGASAGSYTAQTPSQMIPAGKTAVAVSAQLSLLPAGTTIHYRLVAMHGGIATEDGADASFETLPSPAPKPRVTASTTPHRAHHKPFRFNTFGRIIAPTGDPYPAPCTGTATVTFYKGRRALGSTAVPIQPNCTYFAQTTFGRLPGRGPKHRTVKLKVVVSYGGNGWLAAAASKRQFVTLT